MKAFGTVHKYGDNVDTDVIIPARYLNSSDPAELAKNCISVKNGEITECTLIGEDKPGSQVLVVSKELYYIQDVTVTTTTNIAGGMKANEVYKVQVGKTLTNK